MCIIAGRLPAGRLLIKWHAMTDILSTGQFVKTINMSPDGPVNREQSSMLGHIKETFLNIWQI